MLVCNEIQFNILQSWGDRYYVGLTGIEIYGKCGGLMGGGIVEYDLLVFRILLRLLIFSIVLGLNYFWQIFCLLMIRLLNPTLTYLDQENNKIPLNIG